MKPIHAFFVLFLGFGQLYGQTFSLSGEVRDQDNGPIPFASVYLLGTEDSLMVKGTAADEQGAFLLEDIAAGLYLLKASYVGRSSNAMALDILGNITIGALIIEQDQELLEGVTVVAGRPQVQRKVDRLVFNVENTVLSQGSTWDILNQTPGVIVVQDGLQIRNQAATVYINDRKVQLSDEEVRSLLENYQGQHIKSVEVINNPPARYDAEGGAVLNIITSKNISLGYKGNVSGTYTQAIFPKYYMGTNHFYKTEKLNLSANYGFAPRKEFKNTKGYVNFMDGTGIFSSWDYDFDQTKRNRTHTAGLALDYEFDARNSINLTSNAQLTPLRTNEAPQQTVVTNRLGAIDSTFTTLNWEDGSKTNVATDFTYKHLFKENGSLTLNGHYTYFKDRNDQNVGSTYFLPNGVPFRDFNFRTDALQDIEIITAQADYTQLFGSLSLAGGVKGSFINSTSVLDYVDLNNGPTFVPALSDNFTYDEAVYAGYLSTTQDWEKWSIKAGLRAEYTESTGTSVARATINDLRYLEFFPSFYVLHNLAEDHSLSFDYSRKLRRPRYEDLNPFRTFISENNFTEGNPNLLPSFSNNFNLGYVLKQEFFFDLYYRNNGAYISTFSFQDNENLVLKDLTQNVLGSISYGFDFNYGKSVTDNWYVYSYVSLFREEETFLALESPEEQFTNSVDGVYVDVTNYLTLSKDGSLKGELGLAYLSGFLQGSYTLKETTNLTLGLRKSFWNQRALLSVAVNDLLGRANPEVYSRYLNQDNGYFVVPETQYVRFGFTYNFGNFRLDGNERDMEKEERERLGEE